MSARTPQLAILYPGDRNARVRADGAASRFAALFEAFKHAGIEVEPAVYHDDFCDEAEAQLRRLRGDAAQERYVLCEINVSSVAPYPESANQAIVDVMRSVLGAA